MSRIIMKLVAVLRIIANGRCWSSDDSKRMNALLDDVMNECWNMEDDVK